MHGMYRLRCSLWLLVAVHSQLVWHYKPLCDGSGTVEETLAVFKGSTAVTCLFRHGSQSRTAFDRAMGVYYRFQTAICGWWNWKLEN